jgi:hypothetical protein
MKFWILSIGVVVAVAYGTRYAIGPSPDDTTRSALFFVGIAIALAGSAAIKISGLGRFTQLIRDMFLGAWLAWGLRKLGLYRPAVVKTFRVFGVDASMGEQGKEQLERRLPIWSRFNDMILLLGWLAVLAGLTVVFAAR